MEPSSPSPRETLLQPRLVAVAAAVLLLTAVVGALAGVFLLAPSSSSTASASLVAAGASVAVTPTASIESASPSASGSLTATASATATATTVTPKPATPKPTTIHLSGTFAFDAKTRWADTGVAIRLNDHLEMTATGTYKVGSSDPGRTPAGVGCAVLPGPETSGFPEPNLTKFAVIYQIDGVPGVGPMCVGGHATLTSGTVGEFEVTVNDDYFNDNSGTITITWTIDRAP